MNAAKATKPVVDDAALRGSVLVLELCGAVSAGVSGLVPAPAVAGTALALVLAALASLRGGHRTLRSGIGFAVVLLAALASVAFAGFGITTLAFVALWLMVTTQLAADTLRELALAPRWPWR